MNKAKQKIKELTELLQQLNKLMIEIISCTTTIIILIKFLL